MKTLIVTDSFKGTLSSIEVCEALKEGLSQSLKNIEVISIPFSDGGEGTLDALEYGLKDRVLSINCTITSSYPNEKKTARYLILDKTTAIIESAQACSLVDVKNRKNPKLTTTFGVGEMIIDALDRGIRSFIITLGGTSTNEMGVGMASALGVRFINNKEENFLPTGCTLSQIVKVDISSIDERIAESDFVVYCDVTNPLLGRDGATYAFAPQKGASETDLVLLENNIYQLNELLKKTLITDISLVKGAGAAGGLAAGLLLFCHAVIKEGAEEMFRILDLDKQLEWADLVITGEGKIDSTTLYNKCIAVLAKKCREKGKRLLAIGGRIDEDSITPLKKIGVTDFLAVNSKPIRSGAKRKLQEAFLNYWKQYEE